MKIKNVTILYWMAASEKQTLKSGHTVSLADGHGLMNWWEIAWTIDLPTDNWLT